MSTSTVAQGDISAEELQSRLTPSMEVQIVDVRTPAEFETAHIAGSRNLPLDVLREHRAEAAKRLGGEVVLVCQSGQRAATAKGLLHESGFDAGRVLQGGVAEWQKRGFDVSRGEQRWEMERQVRLVAGSVVLGSVLSSVAVPQLKWVAAAIGGGLTFAAVSNTCAMASALAKLPYNRGPEQDAKRLVDALGDG
ncbi:rhodanese-like domain-containing protein [Mycobacterium yunnanensis]|uniref:Rhodanese-like domain-containing protein n=1 Tax=Mycobacterium yunnanensis TaxID=368477 RepID=A0A9X3C396_9MYCO|nr:rhodanese-like domain-containing protein [Mycobacterium yunnanensis]MCV7424028.1 rhodanese-like domain-containing protein [Mycobacterium yunnanensis]